MADNEQTDTPVTSGSDSPGNGALASALGVAPAPAPEPTSATISNTLTVPPESAPAQPLSLQPSQPKVSRMHEVLAGVLLGGIPGAITGLLDPQRMARYDAQRQQVAQSNVTFASARAAHEVAMAHNADLELQALPGKLQDEATQRGLDNVSKARENGYVPIASIALDQGQAQNSQNAATALEQVKQASGGAVPSGLLYIHTGSGMTVMRLANPEAALPMINQIQMAKGLPSITGDYFTTLSATDRAGMARDAINFTDPRDTNGMITQNSLNVASMRLLTLQDQPGFNGKDGLVSALQATVKHQTDVLGTGAGADALRKGQAAGVEAQAAQPGETAAAVAKIKATAGPEAAAAAQKAGAVKTAENAADLAALGGQTQDAFGNTVTPPPGGVKEYNKVKDSFKKNADNLTQTEQTFRQFASVLDDINSGKSLTGAQSVVGLFNAIGISAEPLKGKGFRINNNTVQEHVEARGLDQRVYNFFANLKNGEIITPQQIQDYAGIAMDSRKNAYITNFNQARAAGVNPDFLLPQGNGQKLDSSTASIFFTLAGKDPNKARAAAKKSGWTF